MINTRVARLVRSSLPGGVGVHIGLSVAFAACVHAGNVLVVSQPGGGAFTTIHAAVAAAQTGDIVLVRPGVYEGLLFPTEPLVISKSLTLIGDTSAGGTVTLRTPVVASTPDDSHPITLRNIAVEATGEYALSVVRNAFLAEDCSFSVAPGGWTCVNASGGVFVRCTINGPNADPSVPGGTAGSAIEGQGTASQVLALYQCTVRGGDGQDGVSYPSMKLPSPGREGIRSLYEGTVLLESCTVFGGNGGDGTYGPFGSCLAGQQGGPAIRFVALGSGHDMPACLAITTTLQPGNPGGGTPACPSGPLVSAIVGAEFAAFASITVPYHTFYASSPVHAGETLVMAAHGVPGEIVYPLVGAGPSPVSFLSIASVLVPSLPLTILPPILVQQNGTGLGSRVMPSVLGTQGLSLTLQPIMISPAQASAILAHPTSVVLLSAGF